MSPCSRPEARPLLDTAAHAAVAESLPGDEFWAQIPRAHIDAMAFTLPKAFHLACMLLPHAAMLSVIGTYANEESATRAVRGLEPALSIQDMVVVDLDHIVWRKVRPSRGKSFPATAHFAVLMRGKANEVDRARALLS